MTTLEHQVRTDSTTQHPSLRIVRVVPPEPSMTPGTYDVRLELSRPLTPHERRSLRCPGWRLQAVDHHLIVGDTTLERVAQAADLLARVVREVEVNGRRAEAESERRAQAYAARVQAEKDRLAALAGSIRFADPDDGATP
jgi:hypothetical protein